MVQDLIEKINFDLEWSKIIEISNIDLEWQILFEILTLT